MRLVLFLCGVAYGFALHIYIQPPTPECQPIKTLSQADRIDLDNLVVELTADTH